MLNISNKTIIIINLIITKAKALLPQA